MTASTALRMRTTTKDTAEFISAPELPADDRTGDGYGWLDTLTDSPWKVMGAWGVGGWDAGAWPYVIFATATHCDETGLLYGYGTYVKGETCTHWFRTEESSHKAITAEVFRYWKDGQADGPDRLPCSAEELDEECTKPFGCIHRP